MIQSLKDKIQVGTDCYLDGKPLLVFNDIWSVFNDQGQDLPPGGILYRRDQIVAEIALILFEGGKTGSRVISPTVYRLALRLFKMIHINADPVYRIRPLEEERARIRFTRGKNKERRE